MTLESLHFQASVLSGRALFNDGFDSKQLLK